jgi:lipopolysaccharide export LptBFGC system permease protein LptF
MIWWFIVLGFSALVVVCVAIAIYLRIRRHLKTSAATGGNGNDGTDHESIDHI